MAVCWLSARTCSLLRSSFQKTNLAGDWLGIGLLEGLHGFADGSRAIPTLLARRHHRCAVQDGGHGWQESILRRRVRRAPKAVLRLPDLDQAKSAVLNSLSSNDAQRDTGTQSTSS
jgi:hypothetical protein